VYALEGVDRMNGEHERLRGEEATEREALEVLASALKDICSFFFPFVLTYVV
jgi:hypothetical protein